MLKVVGMIMCVAGSFGYGWIQISGWKSIQRETKIWMMIFQKIKSCLLYHKETLESSCMRIGAKEDSEQGRILLRIGIRAQEERQCEFSMIWMEETDGWCKKNGMPVKIRQIICRFPEYIKEADEQLQMELFTVYMEELQQEERNMEHKIKEQQKPVMAVSLVVGLMLSILLV